MAKNYTHSEFDARDFLIADQHGDEVRGWSGVLNGSLSRENLPYSAIQKEKISSGINMDNKFDTNPTGTLRQGLGQIMSTQSYFIVRSQITQAWERPAYDWNGIGVPVKNDVANQLLAPLAQYNYKDGSWQAGIIPLHRRIGRGTFMRIPTREGMLHVEGTINMEFMLQSIVISAEQGQPNIITFIDNRWTMTGYLFVDDKLVASTGEIAAGVKRAWNLSASVPVDSKANTEIDLRFSANYTPRNDPNLLVEFDWDVNIFNCQIWARNQFR